MTEPVQIRVDFAERHWRSLLAAIVVLAAALRLYGLGRFSIWYDESTSLFALQYVDWDLRFLKAEETRLIPLNTLFLFVWYQIVDALPSVRMGSQTSDFLLHILPGTFSALTVPLIFAFGRRVAGSAAAGLVAALLTAVSPFHMYYASELGPHSLYAICVLFAAYFNYRALEENKLGFWIGCVVFETLSFYAYYFSVFYLAAVNLFVLLNWRAYRGVIVRWFVCQAAALALVLPAILLAAFVFQMHASATEHWFPYPTLKTLLLTVKDWFAGYSPSPRVYWPLFVLGVTSCVLGVFALRGRPRSLTFLVIAAFLPPFIQYVFWNTQNFAFYTMRIQLAYSLPAFVLAGAGLTAPPLRRTRLALLAVLLAFTAPALADHFAQRIHPVFEHRLAVRYKVDNRGAAEFIRANWREGDVVAHANTVTLGPFLYHYLMDVPQVFAILGPEEWDEHVRNYPDMKVWESLGFLPERIDEYTAAAPRVWLASAAWEPLQFHPHSILLRAWLDANGVRVMERHEGDVDVYLYDLSPRMRQAVPVDRTLDYGWYSRLIPSTAYELRPMPGGGMSVRTRPSPFPIDDPPVTIPEPRDPAALDVGLGDFSLTGSEYTVRVRNRSTNSRELDVMVRSASSTFSSLGFARETGSDVWRPWFGYEGRIINWARTSAEAPSGTLRCELQPSDEQDLFIELAGEPADSDAVSANLVVEVRMPDGTIQTITMIAGAPMDMTQSNIWQHIGRIPPLPEGGTLELRALSPNGADVARLQLGQVALVSIDNNGFEPVAHTTATIAPLSEKTVAVNVPEDARQNDSALLFEVNDPQYRVHRFLVHHVLRHALGAP